MGRPLCLLCDGTKVKRDHYETEATTLEIRTVVESFRLCKTHEKRLVEILKNRENCDSVL